MISRNDCIVLLTELEHKGIDVEAQIKKVAVSVEPAIDVIKFINDNRELDLTAFYRHIRKSYNQKHSSLYKNIVKEELKDPNESLTTLSALLTQILLYSKKLENKQMFLRHARCNEITAVLNNYFKTSDLTNCLRLLKIIKADLKTLEMIKEK